MGGKKTQNGTYETKRTRRKKHGIFCFFSCCRVSSFLFDCCSDLSLATIRYAHIRIPWYFSCLFAAVPAKSHLSVLSTYLPCLYALAMTRLSVSFLHRLHVHLSSSLYRACLISLYTYLCLTSIDLCPGQPIGHCLVYQPTAHIVRLVCSCTSTCLSDYLPVRSLLRYLSSLSYQSIYP